jgi:MoxR-like ATPase
MQEAQVTVEGVTKIFPKPFFVIATMNPIEQKGTYPLTEAGIDRFTVKVDFDYPSREEEIDIIRRHRTGEFPQLEKVMTGDEILVIREWIEKNIYFDPELEAYVADIIRNTRPGEVPTLDARVEHGVSLRGFWLARVAAVCAFWRGSSYVLPGHIDEVAPLVLAHRIKVHWRATEGGKQDRGKEEAHRVVYEAIEKARKRFKSSI